jgi:hypothetical protein
MKLPLPEQLLDRWRADLRAMVAGLGTNGPIVADDPRPAPAPDIIRGVNSPEKADASVFLRSGATDLLAIVESLADAVEGQTPDADRPRPALPTVMDLGCGVGRLLRHAPDPALARVIATDVNAASLAWCRAHLPGIEYHHHDPLPPIASLPASSIDIVYAHSVFTHIPLEHQAVWLHETPFAPPARFTSSRARYRAMRARSPAARCVRWSGVRRRSSAPCSSSLVDGSVKAARISSWRGARQKSARQSETRRHSDQTEPTARGLEPDSPLVPPHRPHLPPRRPS